MPPDAGEASGGIPPGVKNDRDVDAGGKPFLYAPGRDVNGSPNGA